AYQSEADNSIISLNSACRPSFARQDQDLFDHTKQLLFGISDISFKSEEPITIQDTPALQTTIQGKLSGEPMMLRTVVLKHHDCLYDLMYISRPDNFENSIGEFDQFVSSLRLR